MWMWVFDVHAHVPVHTLLDIYITIFDTHLYMIDPVGEIKDPEEDMEEADDAGMYA